MAERDNTSAGKRCKVNHRIRLNLVDGIGKRIGQRKTAFSVCVVDLDSQTIIRRQNVARMISAATSHVFHSGYETVYTAIAVDARNDFKNTHDRR